MSIFIYVTILNGYGYEFVILYPVRKGFEYHKFVLVLVGYGPNGYEYTHIDTLISHVVLFKKKGLTQSDLARHRSKPVLRQTTAKLARQNLEKMAKKNL